MEWNYSDYIVIILTGIAIIFLLSVVFDYWKGSSGLRKGSALISFVAIILISMPNASDLIFKFGGNELVFKSNEQQKLDQSQLAETSKFIEKQNQILTEKINGVAESLRINGEILNALHKNNADNQETKSKLDNLVQEQKEITKSIAPKLPIFSVQFERIEFNEICEKINSSGEFYYAFMINGNRIVNRSLKDRVSKSKGEVENFSGKSINIQSALKNDTFRLAGFINEYDGETFFRRSLKITSVGEIEEELLLKSGAVQISIGDNNNRVCRATLVLSVVEL